MIREIILIAHNMRSCHNVGSLLRTAEGLGVEKVWLTGYTPYPRKRHDKRMAHISSKLDRQIHKTALGAEELIDWDHTDDVQIVIKELRDAGFVICALEQHESSLPLGGFSAPQKVALLVGREVEGVEPEILERTDLILEIPMSGQKESFNVVQAAAMALYHMRFISSA